MVHEKIDTVINVLLSKPNIVSAAGLGLGTWVQNQLHGATVADFLSGAVMGSVLVFNCIRIYRELNNKKTE